MAHFSPNFNQSDEHYVSQIRKNLRVFHVNLDLGNWDVIEGGLAPDYYWNYDGTIIQTPAAGKAALSYVAGTLLGGVHAQDIYNIVDGNRGAVLFRISGTQGADFFDVPLQPSGQYNVRSTERFVFNADGKARQVTTITPIGIMKSQMKGDIPVLEPMQETLKQSTQTSLEFRDLIRNNMASLHLNILAGNSAANAQIAVHDVENDENGIITRGKDAFVKLIEAHNAGLGSFPNKAFHDVDILADGKHGAVEYTWMAPQESEYKTIAAVEGASVKVRGMLFFEFNHDGLVEKVVSVYDEGVIETTLSKAGSYMYP